MTDNGSVTTNVIDSDSFEMISENENALITIGIEDSEAVRLFIIIHIQSAK